MKKLQAFLVGYLGTLGFFLYFVLSILICIFPLLMFEMSFVLYLILGLAVEFILINIPFGLEALYIVGIFGAASGDWGALAIIYYIVAAFIVIPTIIKVILFFIKR